MRGKWVYMGLVFQCRCTACFLDRFSLTKHIKDKRKGKYWMNHYAGNSVSPDEYSISNYGFKHHIMLYKENKKSKNNVLSRK